MRLSPKSLELIPSYIALALVPVFQRLPWPVLTVMGRGLGELGFLVWGRVRRIARDNMRQALPELPEKEIRRLVHSTFRNWGMFALHTIALPRLKKKDWERLVIVEGADIVYKALDRGKGVLFCSGHLGCFEMGAAYAASQGVPTTGIARYAKTQLITTKMNELRESAGYRILVNDRRGLRAIKALRNNEIVAVLIDQDHGPHGVFVEFFGRLASAPPGPVVMADRTGAALIPAFVVREKNGKYRLTVQPEVPNPGPNASDEAIHEAVQELTRRLEQMVRQYPDQWLWMHRRWKHRPEHRLTAEQAAALEAERAAGASPSAGAPGSSVGAPQSAAGQENPQPGGAPT